MPGYNFFRRGNLYSFRLGCSSLSNDLAARWIRAKPLQSPPLPRPKLLTAALFPRVARGACAGFRCARTTATTFDVFYRLQVTNFGLLKSAPNGLNYMDIRRLFPHGPCRLPHLLLLANICSPCQSKKGTFTAIKMALREKLDFLARML